jgi:predicted ATPase
MLVYRGEVGEAQRLLEQGLAIYAPREHATHAHVYGQDPGVACRSYLSWIALATGSIDVARRHADGALALARELAHPFTLAFALHHAALTCQQHGDGASAHRLVDELLELATREQFPFWATMASITRGGEAMRAGRIDDGVAAIEQGIALHRALGADIGSTYWLALRAEAHARRGDAPHALTVLDEALALVESGQERLWEAELHRLRGDVLLGAFAPGAAPTDADRHGPTAAACFERALEIARAQGTRLWALRAATRRAALWHAQRKRRRALDVLVPVLDGFTEGFDAPDVRTATALRARLES